MIPIWGLCVATGIFFLLGLLVGKGIDNVANLTRDEEQKCVQHILQDYGTDKAKCQALINEVQSFAVNTEQELEHVSAALRGVIVKVKGI